MKYRAIANKVYHDPKDVRGERQVYVSTIRRFVEEQGGELWCPLGRGVGGGEQLFA